MSLQADGAIIVDVREEEEYKEEHLDEAINIPYTAITDRISKYADKDTKIIVYCKSGVRSNKAANSLIEAGYKNIYDLGSISNCK
jgi:rhodanese-related sulfurtransferase